jgi:gluconokinase
MTLAVIVMGVSGSGKTTLGQALAARLGWAFYDADDFHPEANIQKMSSGLPLDDNDRTPWLDNLNELVTNQLQQCKSLVVACSALKEKYREHLSKGCEDQTRFVYLRGDYETISARMQSRKHFMKPDMLQSQFDTLEEPREAVVVDIRLTLGEMLREVVKQLGVEVSNE